MVDALIAACERRPVAASASPELFGRELVPWTDDDAPFAALEAPLEGRGSHKFPSGSHKHARPAGGRAPESPEHKRAAPAGGKRSKANTPPRRSAEVPRGARLSSGGSGFACPALAASPKPENLPMPTTGLLSRATLRGRSPSPAKDGGLARFFAPAAHTLVRPVAAPAPRRRQQQARRGGERGIMASRRGAVVGQALAAGRRGGRCWSGGVGGAAAWARCLSSSSSSSAAGGSGGGHGGEGGSGRGPSALWGALGVAAATGAAVLTSSAAADARRGAPAAKAAPPAAPAAQPDGGGAAAAPPAATGPDGLPVYTAAQVAAHRTPAERVWVTYKDGVFDITDFIAQHPGGAAKIMLAGARRRARAWAGAAACAPRPRGAAHAPPHASRRRARAAAGGSVEPFWGLYQQHQKPEIRGILEKYRVGWLEGGAAAAAPLADPYEREPARHPALLVRSAKPFNAEPPAELLTASGVTPADMFFVRHHLPVPDIEPGSHTLTVGGAGLRSLRLSLEELQTRFKKVELAATVQCTGNRRAEMKVLPAPGGSGHEVQGLDWGVGAISTAVWGGVLLRDVLLAAGLSPSDPDVDHIHFVGLDTDMSGTPYAASIPLSKAMAEGGDVLLAWEMNGQPLPRDHGGPLRAIVPGTTGARSVKWLGRIEASADECQGHWQQRDYKVFSPGTDWDNIDWSSAPAIQEMPVTSAITEPAPGAALSTYDGEVAVKGYAWSGGGREIIRVDVSADGGKTWAPAALSPLPHTKPGRAWAWTLWEAVLPLPDGYVGPVTLVAKATDAAYNVQPEDPAGIWNVRGLNMNAWHRVTVDVAKD
ncbi:hypothetical protein HT031_001583 [Scenedesmus sp. PABB004]|nr:hypothetical protein HT031_001583 [Scenedesmus sp. PABB004]